MPNFDYIIIGAGASGLLLADTLGNDAFFAKKSILILDKDLKNTNDRTWCFWEKGNGDFDAITYKTWRHIFFAGRQLRQTTAIHPYRYKMVRGIDFYEHYRSKLKQYPNIIVRHEEVLSVAQKSDFATVRTTSSIYNTPQVFTSIFDYKNLKKNSRYPILQQHFLGWVVKTEKPIFSLDEATFMDFSIPQKGNTRFMYLLPFAANQALVEYTLFSETPLERQEYENAIKTYLTTKDSGAYEILETETGSIPMTCYNFHQHNSANIVHIGIAGGWAKASTGYTFMKTNQNVKKLAHHLKKGRKAIDFKTKNRFWFYDLLLLDILYKHNHLGRSIFESLFKMHKPQLVFKFLDEKTNFFEEIKIMSAPSPLPFIKALLARIF